MLFVDWRRVSFAALIDAGHKGEEVLWLNGAAAARLIIKPRPWLIVI